MFIIFVRKYNLFPRWIWEGLCFSRFALQAISHCFFARLSLRYLENSWYYTLGAFRSPSEADKDARETLKRDIVASMASLAFMTRWGLGLLIWMLTTTPHFNSARKLCSHICFVSQTNLKCQEYFRVFSKVLVFSELSTKAANRLLLFRYLHKNWTQQVFLRSTLRKLTFEKPVRPVFS